MKSVEEINILTGQILDSCITVHKEMGPGLLESVYEICLLKEFQIRGINAISQFPIPLFYKRYELTKDFRIDILVEDEIVMEIKSCETMLPVFEAQIISYLKLSNKRVGILVNFNVSLLKNGYKRIVNNL